MHTIYGYLIVFLGAGIGGALRDSVNIAAVRLISSGFASFDSRGECLWFTCYGAAGGLVCAQS